MSEWIRLHLGALGGVGGAGGAAAVLGMVFRDSIKEWLQDWKDDRRVRRAERLAAAGKEGQAMTELIKMMKEMIAGQAAQERETIALLGQMATSHERSLDVQRMTSTQMSEIDKRLSRIEGAVNMGRFQS